MSLDVFEKVVEAVHIDFKKKMIASKNKGSFILFAVPIPLGDGPATEITFFAWVKKKANRKVVANELAKKLRARLVKMPDWASMKRSVETGLKKFLRPKKYIYGEVKGFKSKGNDAARFVLEVKEGKIWIRKVETETWVKSNFFPLLKQGKVTKNNLLFKLAGDVVDQTPELDENDEPIDTEDESLSVMEELEELLIEQGLLNNENLKFLQKLEKSGGLDIAKAALDRLDELSLADEPDKAAIKAERVKLARSLNSGKPLPTGLKAMFSPGSKAIMKLADSLADQRMLDAENELFDKIKVLHDKIDVATDAERGRMAFESIALLSKYQAAYTRISNERSSIE